MIKRRNVFGVLMLALLVTLAFATAVSGQGMATPEAPVPGVVVPAPGSGDVRPEDSLGTYYPYTGTLPMTGACPMMGGTGGMMGMSGMGTMSGMGGMTGMSTMGTMSGMGAMPGMSGMSTMPGTMGAYSAYGPSGVSTSGTFGLVAGQNASPFGSNPWWLLGWLVLFAFALALVAAVVLGVVLLIKRFGRATPAGPTA
jgi:hypothetical protein